MKIEIDTDEIVDQIKDELKDTIDALVYRRADEIVSAKVMDALNRQLDHIEKTPYNIIHHRLYVMLDKYIEQEIRNRAEEHEFNGRITE